MRADLEVGVAASLLHQIAGLLHVRDLNRHVVGGAVVLADPLLTRGRIVGIETRKLGFRVGIAGRRVDRFTLATRELPAKAKLPLVERSHGFAVRCHQANMPDVGGDSVRTEELAARQRLLGTRCVLNEVDVVIARGRDTEHRIPVGARADRRGIGATFGVDAVELLKIGAQDRDSSNPPQFPWLQPGNDLDVLIVVDLEEDRRGRTRRVLQREGLLKAQHALVVATRLVEIAGPERNPGQAKNRQVHGCRSCCTGRRGWSRLRRVALSHSYRTSQHRKQWSDKHASEFHVLFPYNC